MWVLSLLSSAWEELWKLATPLNNFEACVAAILVACVLFILRGLVETRVRPALAARRRRKVAASIDGAVIDQLLGHDSHHPHLFDPEHADYPWYLRLHMAMGDRAACEFGDRAHHVKYRGHWFAFKTTPGSNARLRRALTLLLDSKPDPRGLSNVVAIDAVTPARGGLCLVMDNHRYNLESLWSCIVYPLSRAEHLVITIQLARGLAQLHARGLVHMGLHPRNVAVWFVPSAEKYVDSGVLLKLGDFGELTKQGDLVPAASDCAFRHPALRRSESDEHGDSNGARAETRHDLWSLGIILAYFMHAFPVRSPRGRSGQEVQAQLLNVPRPESKPTLDLVARLTDLTADREPPSAAEIERIACSRLSELPRADIDRVIGNLGTERSTRIRYALLTQALRDRGTTGKGGVIR